MIGTDVSHFCLIILNDSMDVTEVNFTSIMLIPKTPSADRMSMFRPISLYPVLYKIMSKTIANRLKLTLDGA